MLDRTVRLNLSSPQALPFKATASEEAQHHLADAAWQVTQSGTLAVGRILGSVLAADRAARAAVLQGGSWDAAAQRVRSAAADELSAAHARALGCAAVLDLLWSARKLACFHGARAPCCMMQGAAAATTPGRELGRASVGNAA